MAVFRLSVIALCCIMLPAVPAGSTDPGPLDRAAEFIEEGRPSDALALLSGITPEPENVARYHTLSSKALVAKGDYLQAIGHLRSAYIFTPEGGDRQLLLLERAEAYLAAGYFHEAELVFRAFALQYPSSILAERASAGFARALCETGRLREALEQFRKSAEGPEKAFGIANTLQRLGMTKEADAAYGNALSRFRAFLTSVPRNAYAYGDFLRQSGRGGEASVLLSGIKDERYKDRAEISLGLLSLSRADDAAAAGHFSAALASADREVRRRALLHLADIDERAGAVGKAKERLGEIVQSHPYNAEYDEALLRLSRLAQQEGRQDDAVRILKRLVFRHNPPPAALDVAEALIRDTKEKQPSSLPELWAAVGSLLLDPSRERFLLEISGALRDGGEAAALDIMRFLLRHGSETAKTKAAAMLAAAALEQGKFAAAQEHLKTLRLRKSAGDEVLRIESLLAAAGGDRKTAAQKLIAIRTPSTEDLLRMGEMLKQGVAPSAMAGRYERFAAGRMEDAGLVLQRADILYAGGRAAEALRLYRIVLEKDGQNQWAAYRLGLLSSGEQAQEVLSRVDGSGSVPGAMARALQKEKMLSEKIEGRF